MARKRILPALLVTVLAVVGVWLYWENSHNEDPSAPDTTLADGGAARPDQSQPPVDPTGQNDAHVADEPLVDSPPVAAVGATSRTAADLGAFDSWTARYLAEADAARRSAMIPEGMAIAQRRREVLYDLIKSDPQAALRRQIPWAVRQAMPPEISVFLEDRVDGVGEFNAVAAIPLGEADENFRAVRRETVIGDARYDTYVFGRRAEIGSRPRIAVHGIVIDGRLALSDSPVRLLDPGEPAAPDRRVVETCAVSGKVTTPGSADAPAAAIRADTGVQVVYLCSSGHVEALAASLSEDEDTGVGGASGQPGPGGEGGGDSTVGTQSFLMIRVRFADQPASFEPQSLGDAQDMIARAAAFLSENSFGALHIEGTVTPVYRLPQTSSWYIANDNSGYGLNVLNAARAIAEDPASSPGNDGLPAFNYLDYDREAVRYASGPGSFSGQGYVASRGCWLKTSDHAVLAHELGHNLGLWHANAWRPVDALAPLGGGVNLEYGDVIDTMGPARAGARHFNTWEKNRLDWLPDAAVTGITADGVYTVAAHDLGTGADGSRVLALRVPRDGDRDYWLEFRQHPGWPDSASVRDGLGVRWDPWLSSNGGTQLLDTTPGSPGDRDDATLSIGRTFSDTVAGIHVTPIGRSSIDPNALDVEVHLGVSPGNRAPDVTIDASATTAEPGAPVSFTAGAVDPDGDAISLAWDFADGTSGVAGMATEHAWNAPGDYRVRVTASDRRGGAASASVLVRVGTPEGSRISGRVTDLNGVPIASVQMTHRQTGSSFSHPTAPTDSDGAFTLTGVPAGIWNLEAARPGWTFASSRFVSRVMTPGDVEGADILGYEQGFQIAGTVRTGDGAPVAGALVGTDDIFEPTSSDGVFRLNGLTAGTHILQVSRDGMLFDPVTVVVDLADVEDVTISERTFTVSGEISGVSEGDFIVVTTGAQSTVAVFDPTGDESGVARFSLERVPSGTWSLRASSPGASFSPTNFTLPVTVDHDMGDLLLARDAVAAPGIAGRVTLDGAGLSGVTVSTGAVSAITDRDGGYWLGGLGAGEHLVSVASGANTFIPDEQTVTLTDTDVTGIDFSADGGNASPQFTRLPEVLGATDRPFVRLATAATDDGGSERVRYWWSVITGPDKSVNFIGNGSHAAGEMMAVFPEVGSYVLRVRAIDASGSSTTEQMGVSVTGGVARPDIVEGAQAEPSIVAGELSTRLSVLASTTADPDTLIYTWRLEPGAPGTVEIFPNASASASEVTARFVRSGNYQFEVTVRDVLGQWTRSHVSVYVLETWGAWLSSHFEPGELEDPSLEAALWGELADPDGDGVVNLLEYAFALDPFVADADGATSAPTTGFVTVNDVEYLAISYRPNPDATDIVYRPLVSSDLRTWSDQVVLISAPSDEVVTYRDTVPASAHQRRFMKVEVTR